MEQVLANLSNDEERELAVLQIAEDTEHLDDEQKRAYVRDVLQRGKIGWNHSSFGNMLAKEIEVDTYKQQKPEVEEGVLQCKRCMSRKVFSYQIQTRSADEPMTTIAKCSQCNIGWTENN